VRKGKDSYQIEKEWKSIMSVLTVFSDGKEHRYTDIKRASKLNDPTLAKLLSRFTELKMIKQRWDTSTYPHASYYKPEPELVLYSKSQQETEEQYELIESNLSKTKDLSAILQWIQIVILKRTIEIIRQYKMNNKVEPQLNFLMNTLVWEPFKNLTWKLVESTEKIIDEIDVKKLDKIIENIDSLGE
jgi:hypothetical protein